MTAKAEKSAAIKTLRKTSGKDAALEAEILLARALGITREKLLAHDDRKMPAAACRRFKAFIRRRARHEPIAYIIGHREFFGLPFFVDKNVLIPRPETELLVEEIIKILSPSPGHTATLPPYGGRVKRNIVFDIGTGSGAIAIAVAKNTGAAVIATDFSAAALKVAAKNAALNEVQDRITFLRADLLPQKIKIPAGAIIAANLPYLPEKVWRASAPDVKNFEPRSALVAGADGLRLYDRLFRQILERACRDLTIICEIDPSQKKTFPKLAKKYFPAGRVKIKNDLARLPRLGIIDF